MVSFFEADFWDTYFSYHDKYLFKWRSYQIIEPRACLIYKYDKSSYTLLVLITKRVSSFS